MNARIRKLWNDLGEAFWLVPALMVLGGVMAAQLLLNLDRSDRLPAWLADSNWLYNGGGTGAHTLLGAIASSTIGVAGTAFSITIAALSLAAGQMGPRLLRNFTRDRGNQVTLGAFLGTYSYALMVLRSVRTQEEGRAGPGPSGLLHRPAELVWSDAQAGIANAAHLMDVQKRFTTFHRVFTHGAAAILGLPGEISRRNHGPGNCPCKRQPTRHF